ncbi:MAG: hypothetical protein FD145_427 [Candidatus Saganbacteria bacterium]|uniref:Uncharacterized protein n=1 Tax=Candidatus Saganbacteria bacterium TaxID=2575572 RepID=A0A833P3I4_UNCSA|nr:MAG: hypothetical protein FD145_427 [Candidatus Saganbacteria bacterium]
MSPLKSFTIDSFEEFISIIEKTNKPQYLFDLEDKIICEIALIMNTHGKEKAKEEILKIKSAVLVKIDSQPHVRTILRSFQSSMNAAISVALDCL